MHARPIVPRCCNIVSPELASEIATTRASSSTDAIRTVPAARGASAGQALQCRRQHDTELGGVVGEPLRCDGEPERRDAADRRRATHGQRLDRLRDPFDVVEREPDLLGGQSSLVEHPQGGCSGLEDERTHAIHGA